MMATHVCPHCDTEVTVGHAIAATGLVRCSGCGQHFVPSSANPADSDERPQRSLLRSKEALIAVGAAGLLAVALGFVLLPSARQAPPADPGPSPAASADRQQFDDLRRELAETRLQIERERQRLEEERRALAEATGRAREKQPEAPAPRIEPPPPAPEPKPAQIDDPAAKTLAEYEDFMRKGDLARTGKRLDEALRMYNEALVRKPNDEAAVAARQDVTKLLDDQQDRGKRQDRYAGLMEHGAAALRGHRYDAAIEAFEGALKLFPEDREAQQGVTRAKQGKRDAKANAKKLLAQGNQAMQNQRLDEAAKAFAEAAELTPDDPIALRLQQQTARWLQADASGQGAYARAMMQGVWYYQVGQFANSVRAYTEALRLAPGDFDAQQGLLEARAKLTGAVLNRTEYERRLLLANQALQSNRFGDAIREFNEVLKLLPNDPVALTGLRRARYGQAMNQGQSALLARRYADAARFFQEALTLAPGDMAAQNGLRQAMALRR